MLKTDYLQRGIPKSILHILGKTHAHITCSIASQLLKWIIRKIHV
jgi:hypothetical protein